MNQFFGVYHCTKFRVRRALRVSIFENDVYNFKLNTNTLIQSLAHTFFFSPRRECAGKMLRFNILYAKYSGKRVRQADDIADK